MAFAKPAGGKHVDADDAQRIEFGGQPFEDLRRRVGRAVVDDREIQIDVLLSQQPAHRLLDAGRLVARGNHDRNRRQRPGVGVLISRRQHRRRPKVHQNGRRKQPPNHRDRQHDIDHQGIGLSEMVVGSCAVRLESLTYGLLRGEQSAGFHPFRRPIGPMRNFVGRRAKAVAVAALWI